MSKNSPPKYYQKNKESFQQKPHERDQDLSEGEEKVKTTVRSRKM